MILFISSLLPFLFLNSIINSMGFPGGSDCKESACNAGHLGLIPGCGEDPLEKEMTTHSSILACRIPRTEEAGWLQSMGFQRVGHDWATNTAAINSTTFSIHLKSYIYLFVSLALKPVKTGTVLYFFIYILLIYWAELGPSCGTQDLWSSLQQAGSLASAFELLAVARRIYFSDQRLNPGPWIGNTES